MTKRTYLFIFLLSLLFAIGIAAFQHSPGYMDADYYFATGLQLAEGKGFTEPFLWNYLDDPAGLPHPSHAYWMPLASLISALALRIAPGFEFDSAQWIFVLLSALIPPLTATLAFSLTKRRDLAIIAALLALLSGYYTPFLTTTDTFAIYMLLGGGFFLVLNIERPELRAILLGLLSALMHLSRADGALWLVVAAGFIFYSARKKKLSFLFSLFLLIVSYLVIMLPWFSRNLATFGTPLAPGGDKMLWLTRYDQLFTYQPDLLTFNTWLASGWSAILAARFWALKLNLGTTLGVQGGVLFLPFIVVGAWQLRKTAQVCVGVFAWLVTFLVMSFIFPFAGARGSFFHSGAALQPLWWALTPLGLDRVIRWVAEKRRWRIREANIVFQAGLVGIALLMTATLFWGRQISPSADQASGGGVPHYRLVEAFLQSQPDPAGAVIVSNPPGYFLASGRPALALPDGDIQVVFEIAARYGARYLVLETGSVTAGLMPIYNAPRTYENLTFLAEMEGAQIFAIETQP